MNKRFHWDFWAGVTLLSIAVFALFLIYPLFSLFVSAFQDASTGAWSMQNFVHFFERKYYYQSMINSFSVTTCVTILAVIIGTIVAYFMTLYKIKFKSAVEICIVISLLSPPFIGAYSWILIGGRNGYVTRFLAQYGIDFPSIYGFAGILLVLTLKLYPFIYLYVAGAMKNIDSALIEAAESLGCSGIRKVLTIIVPLITPTILAGALMVFMNAMADFGTPMLIGEGYQTFPVMIYNAYLGEGGADRNFAAALAVVAVVITAIVFAIQKWGTNRFKFSMNALHPVEKKEAKGVFGFLMHAYCYLLVGIAFMPQLYIIYLSFCNYKGSIRQGGYGLGNYVQASKKLLSRSIKNTAVMGIIALIVIVILAVLIAYLVVRRASALNNAIDTISMLPYIMPGAVVGLALLLAFGKKPLALTGTFAIMVISFVIRRLPYTIRSATATLMQISPSIEEAAISLGASKAKTFVRITVPMMANGILSGAILSWVAIVTELSSSIILYSNKSITLTMSTYLAILRGNDGIAAAFAAILTVVTAVSLLLYLKVSKSEDVRL